MEKARKRIPMWFRYIINAVLFAAFLFLGKHLIDAKIISTYYSKVLMLIGINIILAVSLNVATGYLGQLPLGHAGFMAVGAYSSAIFMTRVGPHLPKSLAFILGILIAAAVAGIISFLIGLPALRLKGDYIAIITLGFSEIIRVVLLNIDSVLGFRFTYGAASLKNIPKTTTFVNAFLFVGITCFLIHTLMKSRHGRAILAIRENEIAADSCGVNTTFYKTFGFVISAVFAGIAGSLYAGYLGILNPGNFGFMKSIEILVMVVLGGMGSMIGSVAAAVVLTAVPEILRSFAEYRMIIYSLLLILMMIFKPSGLFGSYDFSLSRILEKLMNGELFARKKTGKAGE